MARFPFEEWRLEHCRLTAFALDDLPLSPNWWRSVADDEPDEMTTSHKQKTWGATGELLGGTLELKCHQGRIDWRLAPKLMTPEDMTAIAEPIQLGPAHEVIERFRDAMVRWLTVPGLPRITRLAFGGVLMHPEKSREDAYALLPDYVPVRLEGECLDFLFQINRPVTSRLDIENLRLNRLTKWSVASWRYMALVVNERTGAPREISRAEPSHFLRTEFDVNTSPTFDGVLPRLPEVLGELVSHAILAATEGVIGR